jgi:hypothetical protein
MVADPRAPIYRSGMTFETLQQLSELQRAALPALGTVYAWMPLKAHATTAVRVLSVTWIDGQFWVEAVDLRNTSRVVRKTLAVWVTSTVLLDDDAAQAAEISAASGR